MKNDATMARLMKAGKTLFSAHGYRNVTVRQLVAEADVNVSLVSYHFGGKEGLYRACLESFALERIRSSTRFLENPDSPEAFRLRLELFITEQFDIFIDEPEIITIILQEHEEGSDYAEEIYGSTFLPLVEGLEAFLLQGVAQGYLSDGGDPSLVSWMVFMIIGKLFGIAGRVGGPFMLEDMRQKQTRETMVRHIVAMTIGGFEVTK